MEDIKFVHTNLLAKDWKKLAQFYIEVLDCKPEYPERDMDGDWIDKMTNIKGVHITGIHLKLPGYTNGPTLEIFSYNHKIKRIKVKQINEIGFTHIAFRVKKIHGYIKKILEYGGSFYGEITETVIPDVGKLQAVYMRDPEGNIVELQNWELLSKKEKRILKIGKI